MERDRKYLASLSPELRILVLSAGPASTEDELRAEVAAPGVNWEVVLELADFERATAILWRRISTYAPASMDTVTRQKFERMALIGDFTSSYLEQRASETLSTLGAAQIDAIVLKGVALAVSVYHSFFERPMGDIDLLVDPKRAEEAWRVAQDAGWVWDAARYPRANYVGHAHLPPLLDNRGKILRLEVHAQLFVEGGSFSLTGDDLRARGKVMPIGSGGGRAIVPCREHLLLHTCIHLAWSHMMSFGGWRAFRDVAVLTSRDFNWALFEEETKRNRAQTCAYWTLRFTERLLGAEIPEDTMRRLSRASNSMFRRAAERHFEREIFPVGSRCPSQLLRRLLWGRGILPTESGHGLVRPWVLDEAGSHSDDASAEPAASVLIKGVAGKFAQVTEVFEYLRMLTQ